MPLRTLVPLALLAGCCTPKHVVVTDIDETITTQNAEWDSEIADPTYDPAMRPDANTLMQGYADDGYTVIYVTGRYSGLTLSNGETATDATAAWLQRHDFPYASNNLFLASTDNIFGDALTAYKAGIVEQFTAAGWTTDWAYGNASTDIDAYLQAGVASDHIFLVGSLAGTMGVAGITDSDAYTNHMATQLPLVTPVTCAS